MVLDEYEIKYLISKKNYERLSEIFCNRNAVTFEQTNYYYDTPDQKLRKRNITARIREKNGNLIGVIKSHSAETIHSREISFRVEMIANVISYNGENLYLNGSLCTRRTEVNICDGITLMLDHNRYLDVEDYEMEIEYDKQQDVAMPDRLQAAIDEMKMLVNSQSKSERFFRRLDSLKNLC